MRSTNPRIFLIILLLFIPVLPMLQGCGGGDVAVEGAQTRRKPLPTTVAIFSPIIGNELKLNESTNDWETTTDSGKNHIWEFWWQRYGRSIDQMAAAVRIDLVPAGKGPVNIFPDIAQNLIYAWDDNKAMTHADFGKLTPDRNLQGDYTVVLTHQLPEGVLDGETREVFEFIVHVR